MDRQFRVAVVGATGLVGETIITVLEERGFPVSQLHALASNRSLGRSVSFRGRRYPVQELADFDFAHCDFALFSAGAQVSREYVPRAVAAGRADSPSSNSSTARTPSKRSNASTDSSSTGARSR